VSSFPPIASEFYGTASVNWTNASVGMNVTVYDPDNVLCGSFTIVEEGYYGLISCKGYDNETNSVDEGAEADESLFFFVNNERAVMFGNNTWGEGTFNDVNLSAQNYPPYFLHNLTHQYINETLTLIYDINASDLNYWDNLTYHDNTSMFNISLNKGLINWTPRDEHVGNHSVNITVSDGRLNISEVLNITVYDVNNAPLLSSIGNQIAVTDENFTLYINATDSDINDNLTFYANTSLFEIENINNRSAIINFTPQVSQVGNYSINISVTDGIYWDWELIHFRIVRGPYCGDGVCGIDENCHNCPEDCGPCPQPPTKPSTGGESEEEGAGGEEGETQYNRRTYPSVCHEKWECTQWSECRPEGFQYRTCIDVNKCGTTEDKPKEKRECTYIGTCDDGIQNCHDGSCEEGIDCGGPCGPCKVPASCYDGIQNCHDGSCEEGIDCGGPCGPCEIKKHAEVPLFEGPFCIARYPWILLFLVSAIMFMTTAGDHVYIKKITKKQLKEYRKLMIKYKKIRHRIYAVSVALCSVIIIISLYIYLNQCKNLYWLFYFWIPVIIAISIAGLSYLNSKWTYDEVRKKRAERRMMEMDKRNTENIVKVQEESLKNMELKLGMNLYNNISNSKLDENISKAAREIYSIIKRSVEKRKVILSDVKTDNQQVARVKNILSDLVFINLSRNYFELRRVMESLKKLEKYLERKRTDKTKELNLINDFMFEMRELANDKHIMTVIKSSGKIAEVYNELVEIYSYYEEQIETKRKTQEDIVEIEEEFQRKMEEITNRPGIIPTVEKNPYLTANYNRMVDLYNNYSKRKELLNELKEKEIRKRHSA
jgi:cellulose biosynthesis protein BcsQ